MSDEFWYDSILFFVGNILTKEEYDSQVIFDVGLLSILSTADSKDPDAVWYSFTEDEKFIQQGSPGKKLSHAMKIRQGLDKNSDIIASFGDLLIHLDTEKRMKWRPYFRRTNSLINIAEKLLFPQTNDDFKICEIYWDKRQKDHEDVVDLPWMTPGDHDQIQEELRFLSHTWDNKLGMTKDMNMLKFDVGVLERYRNHKNCKLNISDGSFCSISFLNYNEESVISTNFFFRTESMIMMYARDFALIPPKEREYWKQFQIN